MICLPELPEQYEWRIDSNALSFGRLDFDVHVRNLHHLVGYVRSNDCEVVMPDEARAYVIAAVATTVQEAVDILATRILLGMMTAD